LTLLVHRRKPFFYFMPGYPGASRAFSTRKLLIAAACDSCIQVSQADGPYRGMHTPYSYRATCRFINVCFYVIMAVLRVAQGADPPPARAPPQAPGAAPAPAEAEAEAAAWAPAPAPAPAQWLSAQPVALRPSSAADVVTVAAELCLAAGCRAPAMLIEST
jgi:hypothetical protein